MQLGLGLNLRSRCQFDHRAEIQPLRLAYPNASVVATANHT
jgi:hypothetical protein